MKSYRFTAITLILAAALAPLGHAQATGAVNATTNAAANAAAQTQAANAASAAASRTTTAAQGAVNAANNAASNASVNAGTAASNAAAAGTAAAGANAAAGIGNSASGAATVRPGTNPGATVSASGSSTVSTNGQAGGLTVSALAEQGAVASLSSDVVVGRIRDTAMVTRDRVSIEVQTRVDASARALSRTQDRANALRGEAKARFQAAVNEVRQRERQVRSSLIAFRNASANKINDARSELADSYEAYASAVTQLEVAGQVGSNN